MGLPDTNNDVLAPAKAEGEQRRERGEHQGVDDRASARSLGWNPIDVDIVEARRELHIRDH